MLKISIQKGKELFLKSVKTTLYVREWETILQIQQKHDLEAYDNTFIFLTLDILFYLMFMMKLQEQLSLCTEMLCKYLSISQ